MNPNRNESRDRGRQSETIEQVGGGYERTDPITPRVAMWLWWIVATMAGDTLNRPYPGSV